MRRGYTQRKAGAGGRQHLFIVWQEAGRHRHRQVYTYHRAGTAGAAADEQALVHPTRSAVPYALYVDGTPSPQGSSRRGRRACAATGGDWRRARYMAAGRRAGPTVTHMRGTARWRWYLQAGSGVSTVP